MVKRDKDYAVYHSLFGQLCFIDQDGIDFLKSFQVPRTVNDVLQSNDQSEHSEIETYINKLTARCFLVPDGFDEYEIVEKDMKKRKENLKSGYLVRALQLVTSNYCNFRCKYCIVDSVYNSKERSEFQNDSSNKQMSFEVAEMSVKKLIELLRKNGNKYLNIEFFGGEPLMNWPVIEYVLETFKNGREDDVRVLYNVTTNGSLINEKMAKIFKKYGVSVVISFDSPKNTERCLPDGRNSLELIKRSLEILKRNKNWVTFNSVISKETINNYDGNSLVDFARYYNIAMIGLILDLDLDFYQEDTNKKRLIEKIWDTYRYAEIQEVPIVGYWHQIFDQIRGKQPLSYVAGYKTCPATGVKLSVEPEGHVFICKCCSGYLGHISDLDSILSSDKYGEYVMRAYQNAPECGGCEIEAFCSGVCMGSLEKKYNSLNVIEKSSCDVFKELTRKLLKNLDENQAHILYMPKPIEVKI